MYLDGYDLGNWIQVSYVGYFDEEVEDLIVFVVYADDVASAGFDLALLMGSCWFSVLLKVPDYSIVWRFRERLAETGKDRLGVTA